MSEPGPDIRGARDHESSGETGHGAWFYAGAVLIEAGIVVILWAVGWYFAG